jgi:PmbA protein
MAVEEIKRLVADAVGTARSSGADTAEAALMENTEFYVTVRNGDIEQIIESLSSRLLVTVSRDKRMATVTSSDLSPSSINSLITEGIELACVMDPDEYFGLPSPDEQGRLEDDLGIFDPEIVSLQTDRKIALATDLERAALKIDDRIIPDGAAFASGVKRIAYANSQGFCDGYSRTMNSIELSCAIQDEEGQAENPGKKQSSYWFSTATHYSELESIEEVAEKAVSRTLRKLGAVKPGTCEVPVVFDPLTAMEFVQWIAKAVRGSNIYRKSSFLVDRRGERVGSPLLTIVDDPSLTGRLGSRPFDGEGVTSRKTIVIEGGILENYLMDSYEARKLGLRTTGNAGGSSNFYMAPGASSPEEIIASVTEGLYLTNLFGPGANWSTGDFSQGGQGVWIENGRLSHAVNEFTIASTFTQILAGIVMVGNDLSWRKPFAAPTFKVERMTISGT